jgi:DNA-binding transcriptional LysR family regulator
MCLGARRRLARPSVKRSLPPAPAGEHAHAVPSRPTRAEPSASGFTARGAASASVSTVSRSGAPTAPAAAPSSPGYKGDVHELRFGDMLTFLAVARSSSLTAAARERKVTPSQVSKAVTRLEAHFGRRLLERGSRGVLLSDAGRRIAPILEEVVAQLESVRGVDPDATELQMGAPSYLQTVLLPAIAHAAPNLRVRAFELPPSLLRANAQDEGFDVLLLPGSGAHLPPSWEAEPIGELRKGIFAAPAVAARLGRPPIPPSALADVPFVMPVYKTQGRIVPVDDDCPIPRTMRRLGHQVQTILVALEVAASSDQIVFGPVVAAHRHVKAGVLVEVPVQGWSVCEDLAFACHVDRVSARLRAALSASLRATMAAVYGDAAPGR